MATIPDVDPRLVELREELANRPSLELIRAALEQQGASPERIEEVLKEAALSYEISDHMAALGDRMNAGEEITWEMIHSEVNEISERHGLIWGMPLPAPDSAGGELDKQHHLVLHRRVPLAGVLEHNQRTDLERELTTLQKAVVRNSWSKLGDMDVAVVATEEGPMALTAWHAGARLRRFLDGAMLRSRTALSPEAEFRAMDSLKARINAQQWKSYVLNGVFPEHSKRSDLHYFFRKGLPTLVISFHGESAKSGKVLAALCLHPMGYYSGTHVGIMCPTDEVIAALVLMRADEKKLWARSGQWSASDPRSGL